MPDSGSGTGPDVEIFDCAGCQVELVDAAGVLAAAGAQRVDLMPAATFPAPVQAVRLTVSGDVRDGRSVLLLEATIEVADDGPSPDWIRSRVLGNDPLGVLLKRRLDAGDVWAAQLVDGVGNLAARAYRLRRPEQGGERPAGTSVRADDADRLRATVSYDERTPAGGRIVAVSAEVDAATATAADLRAMCCVVFPVIEELAGPGSLAGRRYALGRQPAPPPGASERSDRVTLDQVGGLAEVVAQFRQVAVSFEHPEAMARWGARRPQGILMYGPPGTGKTMLARALAEEIGADFREVRTPEILDKWLGASERNIKRIFRAARAYRRPTVLLFDEFDSIISYAGAGGDAASQAVNAVAGIFKQEMNNLIEENPNVIVVATTNFPHRVDESLVRSGRFDIKISIPRPDEGGRAEIIAKMVRQLAARHDAPGFRMFADDVDPLDLARVSVGMTGADLKEVLRRVQLDKAMLEARSGSMAAPISQDDLRRAITELARPAA